MSNTFIDQIYDKFNHVTKKPEKFLSAPEKLINNVKDCLKEIYDFIKNDETIKVSNTLPTLIVNNFDVEQIWQQIELQNNEILTEHLSSVSRLVASKDKLWFINDDDDDDDDNKVNIKSPEIDNGSANESSISEDEQNENIDDSLKIENNDEATEPVAKSKKSIVDDDFFKLDEMEKFLQHEERSPKKHKKDSDDEETVDLFDMKSDDEFEDDSENDDEDNAENNPKYDKFFGGNDVSKSKKRKLSDESNDDNSEVENEEINFKSSLELREERLHKRIEVIEEKALKDKSWQYKGEVTADKRPQNSLLEEIVDFDMTVRPAHVITEETTYKLEDVIKRRIKDKVWDDVERKVKFVETPFEYKKKIMLDQEKSKQSLAQIYETEYLKQKEALNPDAADKPDDEPTEHIEIKLLMKNLFAKLDALSNFHFTPKSAAPELRVVNNLPAITMEEVVPVAASEASLLAPEEIKKKPRGDVIGKGERSETDKNRERRQKKMKQREHANEKKNKEKLITKMKPGLANKYSKQKTVNLLNKITKDRNVNKMDESTGSYGIKSSTSFFTKLQDEVKGQIKTKNKTKQTFIAKKLKL